MIDVLTQSHAMQITLEFLREKKSRAQQYHLRSASPHAAANSPGYKVSIPAQGICRKLSAVEAAGVAGPGPFGS